MMKSEKINAYVATLAVWNVKLHNIHWNVEGHLFKGIHEYTESLYDRAAEQYDETAEILKMRGEMPVASIAESLKASVIEELPRESSPAAKPSLSFRPIWKRSRSWPAKFAMPRLRRMISRCRGRLKLSRRICQGSVVPSRDALRCACRGGL